MEAFCCFFFLFFLNIAEQIVLSRVYNLAATSNAETEVNIYNGASGEQQQPLSPLIHQTPPKSKIHPLNCENLSAVIGPQREPEAGEAGLLFDGRRRIKLQFGEVGMGGGVLNIRRIHLSRWRRGKYANGVRERCHGRFHSLISQSKY